MLEPFHSHKGTIGSVAFSPNGENVVSCGYNTTSPLSTEVIVWNSLTGERVLKFKAKHKDMVCSACYSPDGQYILTGSWDDSIHISDAKTGKFIKKITGHNGRVYHAIYSSDGSMIASASGDKTARLWDAESGNQLRVFEAHTAWVNSVAFSPDGKHLVSAAMDDTIYLWDVASGQLVSELTGHTSAVLTVAYSPDGRIIVSGGSDNTIRFWDATGNFKEVWKVDDSNRVGWDLVPSAQKVLHSIPADGWIRTPKDELLMWVAPEYANGVRDVSFKCLPEASAGHPVVLDCTKFVHGRDWIHVKGSLAE
jgi:WD40 repeat protein